MHGRPCKPDHELQMRARRTADWLARLLCGLVAVAAAGCAQEAVPEKAPAAVKAQTVEFTDYAPRVELTGEIKAQIQGDLSFRVSGRVIERNVDVGSHVTPEQPLAQLDPQEQEANVRSAEANVQAAEAQLRQATSTFERQRTLLAQGFTTRANYDQAEQAFRTAQGSLDAARAQLATAREQLSYTTLRAGVSGIITARNVEVGQVVQAVQTVFTIAHDGPRDAVFQVHESAFGRGQANPAVQLVLVSDPNVRTTGTVREVSPTVDPATGTVRVKVGIEQTPPAMTLGAAVIGSTQFKARKLVILPWGALASRDGEPAVWVVHRETRAVSLKPVTIDGYDTGVLLIRDGLEPGEIVVTTGGHLLRPNQTVALAGEAPR
jgi:membrane fusion protein, multidrug efflux system